ncbi:hypothetical protein ODZ83_00170 [Acaricomes phytoseiuli]|uniref:hypothetical protein n=1 Tax=Acaricomes phytoseiuli TaxID=291968 RepID=UPI0012E9CDDF|nr:hypothetical protein [Acaricomes phytoseiuli]MCW1248632.1 hypothetical protein [Acaricomes phytoseiuli]
MILKPEPGLWKPLMLRALLSLAFALLTVFWPDLPEAWRSWATAAYLILTAVSLAMLLSVVDNSVAGVRVCLRAEAAVLAFSGVLVLFFQDLGAYLGIVAAALLISGIIEVQLGLRHRKRIVLGGDWILTGAVAAAAGLLLPWIGQAAYRAPAGVVGGAAAIIGVTLLLAALSYRHDAAAAEREKNPLPRVE